MTDLLKEHRGCVIPLTGLIGAFQRKYGRNPFSADVRPITTLNKLSHVIQIMGAETGRTGWFVSSFLGFCLKFGNQTIL